MDHNTTGQICSLLTAGVWATAMVLFKRSGESIPPLALNLFKNALGLTLAALTLVVLGQGWDLLTRYSSRDFAILLISGFLGIAVADTIFFYALNIVGVGIQSIVDCCYSPLVVLFAWWMLGEQLSLSDYLGAAMVLGGVLLSSRHELPAGRTRRQLFLGIVVGILAVGLMGFGIVLAKPILEPSGRNFPLFWAAVIRLLGGTVPLLLYVLLSTQRQSLLSVFRPQRGWRTALPGAFLGAYVSMILWIAGFKYTLAGIAGVLNQTSTIFALILATVFLKERMSGKKLAAVVMAMLGVVIVTVNPEKLLQ